MRSLSVRDILDLFQTEKVVAKNVKPGDLVRANQMWIHVYRKRIDHSMKRHQKNYLAIQSLADGTAFVEPDKEIERIPATFLRGARTKALLDFAERYKALEKEYEKVADEYGTQKERKKFEQFCEKRHDLEMEFEQYRRDLP